MRVSFAVNGDRYRVVDGDARWLIEELREGDEASAAFAERLERAAGSDEAVEATDADTRAMLHLFERSTRPRRRDVRLLEIAIHQAVYGRRQHDAHR